MSDLISREALIEKLKKSIKWCECNLENSTASFQSGCIAAIKDVISTVKMEETCPTVDAVEVVHGHWIWVKDHWECSACRGSRFHDVVLGLDATYCGRCGAKMDEVSE